MRWAAARERRNGPDGFGKTGTLLLYEAAQALADARDALGCAEYALLTGATDDRTEALRLAERVLKA